MFLIIILYALIALTFTLAKISVAAAHPLFFIGVRMMLAGAALLLTFLIMRLCGMRTHGGAQTDGDARMRVFRHFKQPARAQMPLDMNTVLDFAQVALFHVFFAFVPEFWALLYLPSVKVTIIYAMTPFFAIALSYLLYRETITRRQLFGTLLAFACLLPLLLAHNSGCIPALSGISLPDCALIFSVISATYAWFVIKRLMNRGYSLLVINGVGMLIGGILSFLAWYVVRQPGLSPVYDTRMFVFSLVSLILVSNVAVYNLYGWLLKHYSVNVLTVAGFLSPLFGAVYGFVFLGEGFSWYHALATVGIAGGLALFFLDVVRRKE